MYNTLVANIMKSNVAGIKAKFKVYHYYKKNIDIFVKKKKPHRSLRGLRANRSSAYSLVVICITKI
jgi:hypothetical protein